MRITNRSLGVMALIIGVAGFLIHLLAVSSVLALLVWSLCTRQAEVPVEFSGWLASGIDRLLLAGGCSIWLWKESRELSVRSWPWVLLGAVGNIYGVILFYVMERHGPRNISFAESTGDARRETIHAHVLVLLTFGASFQVVMIPVVLWLGQHLVPSGIGWHALVLPGMVKLVGAGIFAAGCGTWLYVEAKRNNRVKWVWLVVGLYLGLLGCVLYYAHNCYRQKLTRAESGGVSPRRAEGSALNGA